MGGKKFGVDLQGDGVKITMTTTVDDHKIVFGSFRESCDAYMVKPIHAASLNEHLKK